MSMRKFGLLLVASLIASPAVAQKDEKHEFTWEGAAHDAEYRAIVDATIAEAISSGLVKSPRCAYDDDAFQPKVYDKFRKRNKLDANVLLYAATCEFEGDRICEVSSFSGEEKCYSGDATIVFDRITFRKDGVSATAKTAFVFFASDRELKSISNIFGYEFNLAKAEAGWRAIDRRFTGMADL